MTFTTFAIMALACYRIVRLAQTDSLFDRPRDAVYRWLAPDPVAVVDGDGEIVEWGDPEGHALGFRRWLYRLTVCQWCLGVWVAAAVVGSYAILTPIDWWTGVTMWLAVAAGQSFCHLVEDKLTER